LVLNLPTSFLPDRVYGVRVLLKDTRVMPYPVLGPLASVTDKNNPVRYLVSGRAAIGVGLSDWVQQQTMNLFQELILNDQGLTGWGGTVWPNGTRYQAGINNTVWCDHGIKFTGRLTSLQRHGGVPTPFWFDIFNNVGLDRRYMDADLDGVECTSVTGD